MSPAETARALQAHHVRTCAGFYMSSVAYRGRAFGARTRAGVLQVTPDFRAWVDIDCDAHYWDHNGRAIGNLPHKR